MASGNDREGGPARSGFPRADAGLGRTCPGLDCTGAGSGRTRPGSPATKIRFVRDEPVSHCTSPKFGNAETGLSGDWFERSGGARCGRRNTVWYGLLLFQPAGFRVHGFAQTCHCHRVPSQTASESAAVIARCVRGGQWKTSRTLVFKTQLFEWTFQLFQSNAFFFTA